MPICLSSSLPCNFAAFLVFCIVNNCTLLLSFDDHVVLQQANSCFDNTCVGALLLYIIFVNSCNTALVGYLVLNCFLFSVCSVLSDLIFLTSTNYVKRFRFTLSKTRTKISVFTSIVQLYFTDKNFTARHFKSPHSHKPK